MAQNLEFLFGYTNIIANLVILLITLLSILVHKLQQLEESKHTDQTSQNVSFSVPKSCRCFSFLEIQHATNNFDEDLVIGRGGFAKVYKGIIDIGASTVAVKRSNCSGSGQGATEFWAEIEMLSKLKHSHLVSLIGYCDDSSEMILVYEYMSGGTLADHLHKRVKNGEGDASYFPRLSWVQRLKICIGAARGLDYLHTGTSTQQRVIHRDVKTTNILLDENLAAKVSDFGLSRTGPADQDFTYVSTHVKGTFGYLDPYYFLTRRLTRKSDVYGFGVVLFEVLCGRPAVDTSLDEEQMGLAGWAQHCYKEGVLDQIIDPTIKQEVLPDSLTVFVKIAIQCLHYAPKHRPTMAEIVVGLESAFSVQEATSHYSLDEGSIDICNKERVDSSSFETNEDYSFEDSSAEEEVIIGANGKRGGEQTPAIFARKVHMFLSATARMFSVHSDTKASTKIGSKNERSKLSEMKVKDEGVLQVRVNFQIFDFAELKRATNNFGADMVLGVGGFWKVYKGWINECPYTPSRFGAGMAVAVKRFHSKNIEGFKEWQKSLTVPPDLVAFLKMVEHSFIQECQKTLDCKVKIDKQD